MIGSRRRRAAVLLAVACALGAIAGASGAEEGPTLPELPAPPDVCAIAPAKLVARISGAAVTRSRASRDPFDIGMGRPSMTPMSTSACEYCAARCSAVPHVLLRVGTLADEPTAETELATEVAIARSGGYPAGHVDGPWHEAYVFGDLEMYALVGSTIVYAGLRESYPARARYRARAAQALVTRVARALGGVPGERVMPAKLGPRPACGLVPARAVAHAIGLERMYSREGMVQRGIGVVADEMIEGFCDFFPGPGALLPAGWFTLAELPSRVEARREYHAELRTAEEMNGDVLRKIRGLGAPATATNDLQVYALVDRFIVQFQYIETYPRHTQHYPHRAAQAVIAVAIRTLQRRGRP